MGNSFSFLASAVGGDSRGVSVVRCSGLCPLDEGGLGVAPGFGVVSSMDGLRPLAAVRIGGEEATVFKAGRSLYVRYGAVEAGGALVRLLYPEVEGEVVAAVGGADEMTLMLEDASGLAGCMRLGLSRSGARVIAEPWTYPSLGLEAVSAGNFSGVCGVRSVPNDFLVSSVLGTSTVKALCGDLEEVYCRCAGDALESGAYVQPALAAYRLLDGRGRVLFESAPVLLSRDNLGESMPAGYVERSLSSEGLVGACTLNLGAWRPRLRIPAGFGAAAPEVAAIELLVGEQFHPWHPDGTGAAVVGLKGSERVVRVSLPGAGNGISGVRAERSARRLTEAVAAFGDMAHCAGRVAVGVLSGAETVVDGVVNPPSVSVGDSARRLEDVLRAGRVKQDGGGRWWRVWARCVAREAGVVALGNLKGLRFGGYKLGGMAVGRSSAGTGHWRAGVSVRFADGRERVVTDEEGTGNPPSLLSGVLSYPSGDAVEMRVQLVYGTSTFDRRFALKADASGRVSVYVNPGFKPVNLLEGEMKLFEVEEAVVVEHAIADGVCICGADGLLRPVMMTRTGSGAPVRGIVVAQSGNMAWDFGRQRFVVGAEDGLYSLAASDSRLSLRLVSALGVGREDALCGAGGSGVYALAGPGGALVNISASGRVSVVREAEGAAGSCLMYLEEQGLLLTGTGRVIDTERGPEYESPGFAGAARVYGCAGRPMFTGADGRLMLGDSEAAGSGQIDWLVRIDSGKGRPRSIVLDMAGSRADVFVDMRQDRLTGTDAESPAVSVAVVHGEVRGPLRLRVMGRRSSTGRLRLRIHGKVSDDFVLRSISFCYDN